MTRDTMLQLLKEETVHYMPNPGNGGDALIASGAFSFFKSNNINFKILAKDTEINSLKGKCVAYAGGGNFIDEYPAAAEFFAKSHKIASKLIILPHTVKGHQALLKSFGDNVYIFCREKVSYEYVSETIQNANVFLSEDLAFELNHTELMKQSGNYPSKLFIKYATRSVLNLQNPLSLNAFRYDVEKTKIEVPKGNIDVSQAINYISSMNDIELVDQTTADIFKFINHFKQVNTNRLHIAIASALLGKSVNFYPNSYYKNKAIYEQSLREFKNVKFHNDIGQ